MSTELYLLCWTLILALAQILLPGFFRTRETGSSYNMGARDEPGPPVGKVTGRLQRAQANLLETLPLFAIAILVAHIAGREGAMTLTGAILYLVARVLYLPLYAAGIPVVRTLVWAASLVGLLLVLVPLLVPGA